MQRAHKGKAAPGLAEGDGLEPDLLQMKAVRMVQFVHLVILPFNAIIHG